MPENVKFCFIPVQAAWYRAGKKDRISPDERAMPMTRMTSRERFNIFSEDHSIPDSVSFDDYKRIVALGKKLGSYE